MFVQRKTLKTLSQGKPALNYSSGDYPESVVLEYSAKPVLDYQCGSPGLVWQTIQEPMAQDNHH